jgi:hypothetical protein
LKEFATTVGSFMRAFSKKMEKIEAGSGTLVGPMGRSLSRHRSLSSICLPLCCALELAFHPLHVFPSIAARPPLCPSSYLYSANQQPHIPRPAAHSHSHSHHCWSLALWLHDAHSHGPVCEWAWGLRGSSCQHGAVPGPGHLSVNQPLRQGGARDQGGG